MMLLGLAILAAITALHVWAARYELPAPFFVAGKYDIWCIHHDEKLVVPDARWLHLRTDGLAQLEDYQPWPVMAAFGLAGPFLPSIGFRLFGLSNLGLRLPALVTGFSINLCALGLAFSMFEPGVALLASVAVMCNYNFFILRHHFILENIGTAAVLAVLWWFSASPEGLTGHLFLTAFISGVLFWVKPNFPLTIWMLLACLGIARHSGMQGLLDVCGGALLGTLVLEGAQIAILARMGIARWRLKNLADTIKVHLGRDHGYLQKHFTPGGWKVFVRFPVLLIDWIAGTALRKVLPTKPVNLAAAATFYGLVLAGTRLGELFWGIGLFLFLQLALATPFFYYPKRVSLLFIPALFSAFAGVAALTGPWPVWMGDVLALAYLGFQVALSFGLVRRKSSEVEQRSIEVGRLVPPGSTIHMHCYPYRFTWQLSERRLISADDQVLTSSMVVERAVPGQDVYLMLTDPGDGSMERLAGRFPLLKRFDCTAAECDIPMTFCLFRMVP
jgi:hypothetical protein